MFNSNSEDIINRAKTEINSDCWRKQIHAKHFDISDLVSSGNPIADLKSGADQYAFNSQVYFREREEGTRKNGPNSTFFLAFSLDIPPLFSLTMLRISISTPTSNI